MSSMSKKGEYRQELATDCALLTGIFAMVALLSWLVAALYFTHEKRMEYGTVTIPKGTFTWNELEEMPLPDYKKLAGDCSHALTNGARGKYPHWYPEDIRDACKSLLRQENKMHYDEMRERLRKLGYLD
jgi:hypothetical protein